MDGQATSDVDGVIVRIDDIGPGCEFWYRDFDSMDEITVEMGEMILNMYDPTDEYVLEF